MSINRWERIAVLCGTLCASLAFGQLQLDGHALSVDTFMPILDRVEKVYHVPWAARTPSIDGRADEWKEIPAIVLDRKEQALGKWEGPADLQGTMRILWDMQALYFCLEVSDDIHNARTPGTKIHPWDAEGWWANDGVQFAFDAYMNGPAARYVRGFPMDGYDVDELTYCVSDSSDGPVIAGYRQRGDTRDTERVLQGLAVRMSLRSDGVRIYEWAIPWGRLEPLSPWILGRCGFSVALNDNDGKGFEGGLMWTPGVTFGQDASKLGQLVFDGAMGSRAAVLPLHPESKLLATTNTSRWLNIEGIVPFDTARLLVRPAKTGPVNATLTVCRQGETKSVAHGRVSHNANADSACVFAWDLSGLPNGRYDLTFDVDGIESTTGSRLSYRQWSMRGLAGLGARREELRRRFGLDRPWDEMIDAPALIQRHRGMVAALLQWIEPGKARGGTGTSGPEGREYVGEDRLKALSDGAEMIAALDAGRDYLAARRNEFWSAYYSPADGWGQQFVMRVPADLDPTVKYPLVVWLHGSNGRPSPDPDYIHTAPYIEIRPWGRGDNSFTGLGEDDVFRAMAHARRWYKIDSTRIYVTGRSMGGSGTWGMAARNPDIFAAAAPICGIACGLPLENLRNVPVLNQHGTEDWVLPLAFSRFAVSALQQMNYPVAYKEIAEWGHELTTAPPLHPVYDWLLERRLNERPPAVTVSCDSPDRGRAYWLTLREFLDVHRVARVDALMNGCGKQQMLTLRTDNVRVLEINTACLPVERGTDLLIQAGYELLTAAPPLPDRLFLVLNDTRWSVTSHWSEASSPIRPYRPGAAADLYTGEPLLVVYGTQGDTNRTALLSRAAESIAGTAWSSHTVNGRFPIKEDRAVTADDLKNFNLVLVGGVKENLLVTRMQDALPFRINEKNELLAGDREPVSLTGAGFRQAYYNPLNSVRLIFIIATDEVGETAEKWLMNAGALMTGSSGHERGDQADLVVETLGASAGNGRGTAVRRLMQFTHGWQWCGGTGEAVRLPETASSARAQVDARLRAMQKTTGCDFALGYGCEPGETAFDFKWFRLADMTTVSAPGQSLLCRMTGQELAEVHRKWIVSNEVAIVPAVDIEKIETNRLYRIAMEPWLCGKLGKGMKQNLRDVQAGPEWRQEDVREEIFGEKTLRAIIDQRIEKPAQVTR